MESLFLITLLLGSIVAKNVEQINPTSKDEFGNTELHNIARFQSTGTK